MPGHEPPAPIRQMCPLPARSERTHKGEVGRVLVLAGSRGMSGAAVLSGLGALRGGAGLVRVGTAAGVQPIVAQSEPCLMTVPLPEDAQGRVAAWSCDGLAESLRWADVVAAGPGLGTGDGVRAVVEAVARQFAGPLVLDADALNNVAGRGEAFWQTRAGRPTVVTPHPGEMARLRAGLRLSAHDEQEDAARLHCAWELACAAGVTVVLKGHRTVVATATETYVNTTGNPGMAAGGMGDVLTGLIAALLGQGLAPFDAARLAVCAHGLAADRLSRRIAPWGYLAREVADELPAALHEVGRAPIGFNR